MLYAENGDEWSRKIAALYNFHCAWPNCEDTFGLGAHHVVPRGLEALALVIDNGVYLCQKHHNIVELKKGKPSYEKIMVLLIGSRRWCFLQEERSKAIEEITNTQKNKEDVGNEMSLTDFNL